VSSLYKSTPYQVDTIPFVNALDIAYSRRTQFSDAYYNLFELILSILFVRLLYL